MYLLNHLAYAAALLLLLELLVMALLFAGISGGLAFGLHWVNGKTEWAFGLVNRYLPMVRTYVHRGTGYVGKPFILLNAGLARLEATAGSLSRQLRDRRAQRQAVPAEPLAAVPVTRPTEPVEPLV